MSAGFVDRGYASARRATALLLALFACAPGERATAFPPRQPVPIPYFAFDAQSPSTNSSQPGVPHVDADAVLAKAGPSDPLPATVYAGQNLGMGMPGDELDGFSFNRTTALRHRQFVILFSVGRATTGDVPPDPALTASDAPFNVADQAQRGHAAGDGFITLVAFDTNGVLGGTRGSYLSSTQAINNFDEGGQDYQAKPPTSSTTYVPIGSPQDNVGATAYSSTYPVRSYNRQGPPNDPEGLYFSASAMSPSLQGGLPGNSGADIFFDPEPQTPGLQQMQPYAFAEQLGLTGADDIDALIVDDADSNGFFGGDDCVYISLTPGSPTLTMLPFVSSNGAADVLRICAVGPGLTDIRSFAASAQLGLAGGADDVDALEIIPCGDANDPCDPLAFGAASGIRLFAGDWNNDGVIGAADTVYFPWCMSGPHTGVLFEVPPPICRDIFDFNSDIDVDLADFGYFQFIFGSEPGMDGP